MPEILWAFWGICGLLIQLRNVVALSSARISSIFHLDFDFKFKHFRGKNVHLSSIFHLDFDFKLKHLRRDIMFAHDDDFAASVIHIFLRHKEGVMV